MTAARLALLVALAACEGVVPEVGPERDAEPLGGGGGEGGGGGATGECDLRDSAPDTPVRFADVEDRIFARRCSCHMFPAGFGAPVGGLLLARRDSALAGGRHRTGGNAIVPGDPCASFIVRKTGAAPPFGARMPLSANPLAAEDYQLLIDWIAEGAQ